MRTRWTQSLENGLKLIPATATALLLLLQAVPALAWQPPFTPGPNYHPYPTYPGPGGYHPNYPAPQRPRPPVTPPAYHPPYTPTPPPYTPPVYPSQPGSYTGDTELIDVVKLTTYVMRGKGCDRTGEALRELANLLLSSATFAATPGSPAPDQVILGSSPSEEAARVRWASHVNSPHFWALVWEQLTQMYHDCNKSCFEDGAAVGQISATGYCAGSIAVNGLGAPGLLRQASIPVCETGNFTGCLNGYDQTVASYPGCQNFASGGYTQIYNESKSQDCHIP